MRFVYLTIATFQLKAFFLHLSVLDALLFLLVLKTPVHI